MLYLLVTLSSGMLLVWFDRRSSGNDQEAHLSRIHQLMDGRVWAERLPGTDLYGRWWHGVFHAYNNTAVNSPVVYYPSLAAMLFRYGDYRLAGMFTLVCSVLTVAAAIRLAGGYRYLVCAVAVLPAVTLSFVYPTADAVTDSVSLLFAGAVLFLHRRARIGWPGVLAMSVLCMLTALTKATCMVLLLLLAIPAAAMWRAGRRADAATLLVPFAAGLGAGLWWQWTVSGIPPLIGAGFTLDQYRASQRLLVSHPVEFLRTMLVGLVQPLDFNHGFDAHNAARNLQFLTGSETNQLTTATMTPLLMATALLMVRANTAQHAMRPPERAVAGIATVVFYALTCAALMLVGNGILTPARLGTYADGMQSRYFIPILAPMALLLPDLGVRIRRRTVTDLLIAACLIVGYAMLVCAHVTGFPEYDPATWHA
ncbi:DUF2142 domain-containing protein [Bifidobacterium miconisargentati]|uniref:DUF2142 domain-containing protein n=1 Tax=Bifidobacterium miconisargentati TaxID=2834437 RepID=UPI001BDC6FA5|nr:DUF2142 domain-containing protein [Bifidobacterium miconisargentati]MBW3091142.1 DUF2142 domain-containing protein [Bifidobacterium miconisargentati]